jgi:hypothetical protein
LRDWEIFNRPSKGLTIPQATLLRVQPAGGPATVRVLEGRLQPPYQNGTNGRDTTFMLHWQNELLGGKDLTLQTLRLRHEGAPSGSQAQVTLAGVPCSAQTSQAGPDITVTLDAPATLTRTQILLVTVSRSSV